MVIHMAAQPLVRRSYREPLLTWATNLTGTVHLLEALRGSPGLKAVLVVTTDKVYRHSGEARAFSEDDELGGHDPYSASKAAVEVAAASYAQSYFDALGVPVATARSGNVLGGGDWSEDRLGPDVWRAAKSGKPIVLRYPDATRPWQHVLDPLAGYLMFVEHLAHDAKRTPRALNFGPDGRSPSMTVKEVVEALAAALDAPRSWAKAEGPQPKEMEHLTLDVRKAMKTLNWRPKLPTADALAWTADWYRRFDRGEPARALAGEQIARFRVFAVTATAARLATCLACGAPMTRTVVDLGLMPLANSYLPSSVPTPRRTQISTACAAMRGLFARSGRSRRARRKTCFPTTPISRPIPTAGSRIAATMPAR